MRRLLAAAVILAALLGFAPSTLHAQSSPAEELAAKYAPIVRSWERDPLVCDGLSYAPRAVEDLFATATRYDDDKDPANAYLDIPGEAGEYDLEDCTFDIVPTVYARIATDPGHPGMLALQYWFFYPFNNWVTSHEGDWELIQLNFAASTVEEALASEPVAVGYSQHSTGQRSAWTDGSLERHDDHPIVYVAEGSQANYYASAVYRWTNGCDAARRSSDDARRSSDDVRNSSADIDLPVVVVLPSLEDASAASFDWLTFEGHWGARGERHSDSPRGPAFQGERWDTPIAWSETWRESAPLMPGFGSSTGHDLACSAFEVGFHVADYWRHSTIALGITAAVFLLVALRTFRAWRRGMRTLMLGL